jgi:hypothetical protein
LDALDALPSLEEVTNDEVLARADAKNVISYIGHSVVISCGDDEDFFEEITVA